jgi:hypothetical protein
MPEVNNHPMGENSPNLVTLLLSVQSKNGKYLTFGKVLAHFAVETLKRN